MYNLLPKIANNQRPIAPDHSCTLSLHDNIVSTGGIGTGGLQTYCSSKAGVIGLWNIFSCVLLRNNSMLIHSLFCSFSILTYHDVRLDYKNACGVLALLKLKSLAIPQYDLL